MICCCLDKRPDIEPNIGLGPIGLSIFDSEIGLLCPVYQQHIWPTSILPVYVYHVGLDDYASIGLVSLIIILWMGTNHKNLKYYWFFQVDESPTVFCNEEIN